MKSHSRLSPSWRLFTALSTRYLLSVVATIVLVTVCVSPVKGQQKSPPPDLSKQLTAIYHKSFKGIEVTIEADKEINQLIDRADSLHKASPGKASVGEIEKRFYAFCQKVLSYAMICNVSKDKVLLYATVVTAQSVESARKSICPLWPFC